MYKLPKTERYFIIPKKISIYVNSSNIYSVFNSYQKNENLKENIKLFNNENETQYCGSYSIKGTTLYINDSLFKPDDLNNNNKFEPNEIIFNCGYRGYFDLEDDKFKSVKTITTFDKQFKFYKSIENNITFKFPDENTCEFFMINLNEQYKKDFYNDKIKIYYEDNKRYFGSGILFDNDNKILTIIDNVSDIIKTLKEETKIIKSNLKYLNIKINEIKNLEKIYMPNLNEISEDVEKIKNKKIKFIFNDKEQCKRVSLASESNLLDKVELHYLDNNN